MKARKNRREFLVCMAGTLASSAFCTNSQAFAPSPPDCQPEISPLRLEIAPRKTIATVAYNGQVPGPLIRWPENKPIRIQVTNRSDVPEIVHWHGLFTTSEMDGSMEQGSPMIPPGATFCLRIHAAACGIPLVSHA